ncbi:MAG: hypothetical protein EOO14_04700 [Chitinophagaceae bacterium]|nr:MAG: hypothetical protein EOO14_04700 [Chitinophagaceae bacterium]
MYYFTGNNAMFPDNLNPLPHWKDRLHTDNEAEAWKWSEELQIGEALYGQWRQVFGLVMAFAENLPEEEDEVLSTKSMIYQNAYVVAPKIFSASGDTLYMIKMENAALIRFNCRQMMEQIGFAVLMDKADERHKEVIDEALETFKQYFRQWVATFKKDSFEDEWGLF